jgi:hypothetical protein
VRLLRKISTHLRLANMCINGASSASFASTFVQSKRDEKRQNMSFGSNGVDQVRSLPKNPIQLHLANLCVNGASSASFASTFVP